MLAAPAVTPAPQAITSTDFGLLGDQRRQVAEHALQAHVLRQAGRLHLAGVVVAEDAVGVARDRRRRVHPLADVEVLLAAVALDGREAPVTDQQRRHGLDRPRHQGGEDQDRHRRGGVAGRVSRRLRKRSAKPGTSTTIAAAAASQIMSARVRRADRGDQNQAGHDRARRSRRRCWRRRRGRRRRAPSWPRVATDASASGKLAPHRQAAGRIAQSAADEIDLELRPGRRRQARVHRPQRHLRGDVPAGPGDRRDQQQPARCRARAAGSRVLPRDRTEPAPLPRPMPIRNTARMIENV